MESVARDVADIFHIAHHIWLNDFINFGDCIWLRLQVQKEEEEPGENLLWQTSSMKLFSLNLSGDNNVFSDDGDRYNSAQ